MNAGYSPKDLKFGDDGRSRLIEGITKLSQAVKSTLGPSGNTVLIESPHHTHGITVTKDGVTVAKSVDLVDPVENLAVRMMKEAAERTATSAGDGTTTAIVLTEALVTTGSSLFSENLSLNRTMVLRSLTSMTNEVVDSLKNRSRPLTKKMMLDVATISSNNDEAVGKIIADVYNKVGKTGMVTVEKSQGSETTFETTTGIKVDRGYATPLFINNHKKDECVYDDCLVLVSDAEIDNIHSIEKVLTHVVEPSKNRKLLIIAPCSQQLTNTLAANVMKQKVKICTIQPPNFGYKQHELMQDIALSLGATYFSEATGDDLSLIKPSDLGVAKKVIVGQDQTIILKEDDSNVDSVKKRVSELKEAAKLATRKEDKDFILSRIASLTGGIGVIRVGGNTDLEQKELFDRVDDAVCAVRSALEEGILPGGGVALYNEHQKIEMKLLNEEYKKAEDLVAATILSDALCSPVCQIIINAGSSFADVYETAMNLVTKEGHGFDVKNAKYGDLIEMGVIDPLKVTRVALQNAVSVAVSILSTNAIITMARTYEQS
jgi:chaperonin GroEL